MKYIGYTTTFIGIAFINSVMNGWAISLLWAWFIASTFGLPEISIPVAIGIALVVSFLTYQETNSTTEGKGFAELMIEAFVKVLLKVLFAVGSGWVVLQFV